jgi:hypothetical protein
MLAIIWESVVIFRIQNGSASKKVWETLVYSNNCRQADRNGGSRTQFSADKCNILTYVRRKLSGWGQWNKHSKLNGLIRKLRTFILVGVNVNQNLTKITPIEMYSHYSKDHSSILPLSGRPKRRSPQPKNYGCPKCLFSTTSSKCTTFKLNTLLRAHLGTKPVLKKYEDFMTKKWQNLLDDIRNGLLSAPS